ncbi:MAG: hypothetical protein U0942_11920 [Parvibaculum sp.]|uniref:hypothetical protein n=1 Tax=Parvibaculum sp. TaxID=2024848 RepID=UPI002AB9309B|nr:hypothetical protein [Parvibaculum sp.]MDZ4382036.1 hypothetical protein [Parvibaculum sp.]
MKALGLLLLRSGFSLLVAVWAAARIVSPEGGIPLVAAWLPEMQPDALSVQLLGGLGVLLALLVLTGFFRLAAYPLLALGLLAAAVSAWPFPEAPLDLVTGGPGTFLLLAVLAVSASMPLLFLGEDRFALDRLSVRRAPAAAALEEVPSTEEVAPAAEAPAAAAPSEPAGDPEPVSATAGAPAAPPVESQVEVAESQVEVAAEEPAAEPAAAEAVACEVPAPAPEPAAESAEPEKTAA